MTYVPLQQQFGDYVAVLSWSLEGEDRQVTRLSDPDPFSDLIRDLDGLLDLVRDNEDPSYLDDVEISVELVTRQVYDQLAGLE